MMRTLLLSLTLFSVSALADVTVTMYSTTQSDQDGKPKSIGTIVLHDSSYGLMIKPNLTDLPPGRHGFHLHEGDSCAEAGKAAGGHFDPQHTGKHLGPTNSQGHLGDLPILFVNENGFATHKTYAPRLHERDLAGHTLIIHAGGDNFLDRPDALGGGGARIACGVIPAKKVTP